MLSFSAWGPGVPGEEGRTSYCIRLVKGNLIGADCVTVSKDPEDPHLRAWVTHFNVPPETVESRESETPAAWTYFPWLYTSVVVVSTDGLHTVLRSMTASLQHRALPGPTNGPLHTCGVFLCA